MEAKRAYTAKKTTTAAPLSKSRSVASLKSNGDNPSEASWRTSTTNKNSSRLRGTSGTPTNLSSKSASKDIRFRSQANLNEINAESLLEEARLDAIDDAFNTYLSLNAMRALSQKLKKKTLGDIDKQISTLQKRVNDNVDALERTRSKLNTVYLVEEQSSLMAQHKAASALSAREPAFTEGKNFEELMIEIDRIKNQLPCRNVCIPETGTELAEFHNATSQLLHSLELISTTYGAQVPFSHTAGELDKISSLRETVRTVKQNADAASQYASATIMKEAILKTSKLKISE